jgi:hypothetical protein
MDTAQPNSKTHLGDLVLQSVQVQMQKKPLVQEPIPQLEPLVDQYQNILSEKDSKPNMEHQGKPLGQDLTK